MTSYKDKSDEFSLSVPASKPPTHCLASFLSIFPPADSCADDAALCMTDMSEAFGCNAPTQVPSCQLLVKPLCSAVCSGGAMSYTVVQATLTHHWIKCTLSCKRTTDCSSNKGDVTYRLGGWGGSSSWCQGLHWGQRCTQSSSLVRFALLVQTHCMWIA